MYGSIIDLMSCVLAFGELGHPIQGLGTPWRSRLPNTAAHRHVQPPQGPCVRIRRRQIGLRPGPLSAQAAAAAAGGAGGGTPARAHDAPSDTAHAARRAGPRPGTGANRTRTAPRAARRPDASKAVRAHTPSGARATATGRVRHRPRAAMTRRARAPSTRRPRTRRRFPTRRPRTTKPAPAPGAALRARERFSHIIPHG